MATTVNDTENLARRLIASLNARERGAFIEWCQTQGPAAELRSRPSRCWSAETA